MQVMFPQNGTGLDRQFEVGIQQPRQCEAVSLKSMGTQIYQSGGSSQLCVQPSWSEQTSLLSNMAQQ